MDTDTFKNTMTGFRDGIKTMVGEAVDVKNLIAKEQGEFVGQNKGEMIANITLAYRHLEDAAMRFGKAVQAAAGGESPLGGPNTPKA